MKIIVENPVVFNEVSRLLRAKCSGEEYDNTVFVLGYNVAEYGPRKVREENPGCRLVIYQLEQFFPGSKWFNAKTKAWLAGCDEIWEYDLGNMDFLKREGFGKKLVYRPMTFCDALADIKPAEKKDIDVLFYGWPTGRRSAFMTEWMGKSWTKYKTIWATGIVGDDLRDYLSRSKIILNIHSFDTGCRQEQVRMFYPVINGLCVVSEKSPLNEFGKAIVESPIGRLSDTLSYVLSNGLWEKIGKDAPEVYRKHCEGRK